MTDKCTQRVFVYGSLMHGLEHHAQMHGASTVGRPVATAAGYYLVLQGRYPALASGGTGRVSGECYEVSAAHLARLDVFEECPQLYQRQAVQLQDGSSAWAYLIASTRAASLQRIECWRTFVGRP